MNKYLEKIAKDFDPSKPYKENKGRVLARGVTESLIGGLAAKGAVAGTRLSSKAKLGANIAGHVIGSIHGAQASRKNQRVEHTLGQLLSGYQITKAAELSKEHKKDIAATATIGASGALTSAALTHPSLAKHLTGRAGRAAIVGGGLGLIGDYAAVKLNNVIGRKIDQGKD